MAKKEQKIEGSFTRAGKISVKQKILADEYLKGKTQKECAKKAGYKDYKLGSATSQVLSKPYVMDYIQEQSQKADERIIVTINWVAGKYRRIVEEFLPEGEKIEIGKAKVAVVALSELSKIFGYYAPTKVLQANINIEDDKEQLLKLVEQYDREF